MNTWSAISGEEPPLWLWVRMLPALDNDQGNVIHDFKAFVRSYFHSD